MVERLGWTLVHFVWEGAVVAGLLALVLLATRRAASNLRYGLALAALVVLAALPLATFLALAPKAETIVASGSLAWSPGVVVSAGRPAQDPMPFLVGVWAVGVLLLSLRLFGTLLHLERWRRRYALPAEPEAQDRLDALARRLGLRRRVALYVSDRLEVPSAWGVLRPLVILPTSLLLGLAPAQAEAVLLHELAHVRRHDYLVNLLQSVVETALFYHPAVWWVSSVVRREREHVCDDLVVDALGDPAPYARALLLLEERRRAPRPALSAKEGKLMDRIARILAPRPAPVRLSPLAPALAALAVVGLALGGVLRAEAQATPPPAPKKSDAPPPSVASARKVGPEEIARNRMREAQRNKLEVQRILLMRKLALSQAAKGHADAALQQAMNARVHALEAQLDAARAEERVLRGTVRPNGATYGTSGKGQQPVWKARNFPQGVGRLVDPASPDGTAFAEAQAALLGASSAQRTAARKAVDDALAQQIAARNTRKGVPSARQQVLELYGQAQAAAAQTRAQRAASDARKTALVNDLPPTMPSRGSAILAPAAVEMENGSIHIDADHANFAGVIRTLAKKARLSVVVEAGPYFDVTVVCEGHSSEDTLAILCKAAHATYRIEGGVYYIVSKLIPAPSGGFGGGGGLGGGQGE